MAKPKIIYICTKCDTQFPKWQGRCTECGAWSTLQQQISTKKKGGLDGAAQAGTLETLAEVEVSEEDRLKSTIFEFDRVVGGGLVSGSLVLLGGDPGIGKSTLILQVGGKLAEAGHQVLYISGEESSSQVKIRFSRLGLNTKNLKFLGETDLDTMVATIETHRPKLVILDSIQTVASQEVDSPAGSVGQVRAVTSKLVKVAKNNKVTIVVIGHVTKKKAV